MTRDENQTYEHFFISNHNDKNFFDPADPEFTSREELSLLQTDFAGRLFNFYFYSHSKQQRWPRSVDKQKMVVEDHRRDECWRITM